MHSTFSPLVLGVNLLGVETEHPLDVMQFQICVTALIFTQSPIAAVSLISGLDLQRQALLSSCQDLWKTVDEVPSARIERIPITATIG
jgi:hypothetical protein